MIQQAHDIDGDPHSRKTMNDIDGFSDLDLSKEKVEPSKERQG